MLKRLLAVSFVCSGLVTSIQADDYQGRVVKVEKDKLTLAVNWKGVFPKGVKVDPPTMVEVTLDAKTKILDFMGKEVKDDATKSRILRPMEYVTVKTEMKNKKETVISVQTIPGAGPGG